MTKTVLSHGWTVRQVLPPNFPRSQVVALRSIPAQVPGHVHLDLERAGVIASPFQECHEAGLNWVDEADWLYECKFDWEPKEDGPRQVLNFLGVDTVCEIKLNGEPIGSHDNFFMSFEIDVTGKLLPQNLLEVHLFSAVKVGEQRRREYFEKHGLAWGTELFEESAFVRKPLYMFGWDWGPRLVSCGIWKPVELLEFSSRITEFTIGQQHLVGNRFRLNASAKVEGVGEPIFTYNGEQVGTEWEVEGPLWWPNSEGEQPMQTVTATLPNGHSISKRIGLRTIELRRESDDIGTSFEFKVNGQGIWCRGANWIPHDSFPSRISDEDYRQALEKYATLGMNMIRVWGGGLYEIDAFYEACDELGLLVWQDFPYACGYTPDDDEHQKVALNEATYQIARLNHHPSLAIWCGNNENRALHYGKWAKNGPERLFGEKLYDETLKSAVETADPGRPYIESSPLLVPNMPGVEDATRYSDDHFWEVWHGKGDWTNYAASTTRFASEFGFASSCSLECWKTVSSRTLTPTDHAVRWHDKTRKPWETFKKLIELHYPEAEDLESWVYFSQLNQRDAMRAAIEHYRTQPGCRGALIWQANDCWPAQSWSLEDYSRVLKPAGFELARLYAPLLAVGKLRQNGLEVGVVNHGANAQNAVLCVTGYGIDGSLASHHERTISAATDALEQSSFGEIEGEFFQITLRSQGSSDSWIFRKEPKDYNLPADPLKAQLVGNTLTLTPTGLVLDLIVWDEADPHSLADSITGLTGFKAFSGVQPITFLVKGKIGHLIARSLAGLHPIVFEP